MVSCRVVVVVVVGHSAAAVASRRQWGEGRKEGEVLTGVSVGVCSTVAGGGAVAVWCVRVRVCVCVPPGSVENLAPRHCCDWVLGVATRRPRLSLSLSLSLLWLSFRLAFSLPLSAVPPVWLACARPGGCSVFIVSLWLMSQLSGYSC